MRTDSETTANAVAADTRAAGLAVLPDYMCERFLTAKDFAEVPRASGAPYRRQSKTIRRCVMWERVAGRVSRYKFCALLSPGRGGVARRSATDAAVSTAAPGTLR